VSDLVKKDGFDYMFMPSACDECGGRCCCGESGYIYLKPKEIDNISSFLSISREMFLEKYTYKKGYKYSLKEQQISDNEFECIFFSKESGSCMIYSVRPEQCRTFPFWDYFKNRIDELKEECPGIVDV